MLIGRAKTREMRIKEVSKILPARAAFGQTPMESSRRLAVAGKNRQGSGKINLDRALSSIAFLPAAFDNP